MSQKLELALLVGAESKAWLRDLESVVARLEKATSGKTGKVTAATQVDEDEELEAAGDDEDEDFAPKKKKTKKVTSFDTDDEDDEMEASSATEDEDDEEETDTFSARTAKTKTAAKKKAPKIGIDDVNDACKALAQSIGGKEGREAVLKILKKKFKTESVTKLKPEQYEDVIEAMAVEDDE